MPLFAPQGVVPGLEGVGVLVEKEEDDGAKKYALALQSLLVLGAVRATP